MVYPSFWQQRIQNGYEFYFYFLFFVFRTTTSSLFRRSESFTVPSPLPFRVLYRSEDVTYSTLPPPMDYLTNAAIEIVRSECGRLVEEVDLVGGWINFYDRDSIFQQTKFAIPIPVRDPPFGDAAADAAAADAAADAAAADAPYDSDNSTTYRVGENHYLFAKSVVSNATMILKENIVRSGPFVLQFKPSRRIRTPDRIIFKTMFPHVLEIDVLVLLPQFPTVFRIVVERTKRWLKSPDTRISIGGHLLLCSILDLTRPAEAEADASTAVPNPDATPLRLAILDCFETANLEKNILGGSGLDEDSFDLVLSSQLLIMLEHLISREGGFIRDFGKMEFLGSDECFDVVDPDGGPDGAPDGGPDGGQATDDQSDDQSDQITDSPSL